jgi:hypothetical protein
LQTPDAQWVNTPYGEQFWIEPALQSGLKLGLGTQGWYWAGRPPPGAVTEALRGAAPAGTHLRGEVSGVPIYDAGPGREYAAVAGTDGSRTVCTATSTGGDVDVRCDAPHPGVLTVKENVWSGWGVRVDGRPAALLAGPWLTVALPPGAHEVAFRYRPWDVPAGLVLCATGIVLATVLWVRDGDDRAQRTATTRARRYAAAHIQGKQHDV